MKIVFIRAPLPHLQSTSLQVYNLQIYTTLKLTHRRAGVSPGGGDSVGRAVVGIGTGRTIVAAAAVDVAIVVVFRGGVVLVIVSPAFVAAAPSPPPRVLVAVPRGLRGGKYRRVGRGDGRGVGPPRLMGVFPLRITLLLLLLLLAAETAEVAVDGRHNNRRLLLVGIFIVSTPAVHRSNRRRRRGAAAADGGRRHYFPFRVVFSAPGFEYGTT